MATASVRAVALAIALSGTAAVGAAGCSSGHGGGNNASVHARSTAPAATRWWSNGAAAAGSTLSASGDAAVGRLHASRQVYCAMLAQTIAAGKSVLGAGRTPESATATKAFVAEVKAVAPTEVSSAWQTLGEALVAALPTHDTATNRRLLSAPAVQRAGTEVAADAKSRCHLDLTAGSR